ncbi:MAG: hypothetical protein KatS3mg024_0104 [Armatimonadota bacterium]|nr:MAG: hypothetical protein KatS3mg024_0104 [Armatimonadota bacterium]
MRALEISDRRYPSLRPVTCPARWQGWVRAGSFARTVGAESRGCLLASGTRSTWRRTNEPDNERVTRVRVAVSTVFDTVENHSIHFNGGSFAEGPGGQWLHQMEAGPAVRLLDLPVGCLREKIHADPLGWMGWGYRRPEIYDRYLAGGSA